MRKVVVFATLLFLSAPAQAAPAVVQHVKNSSNANLTTVSCTFSSTTAGNLLIVGTLNEGTRTVSTVTGAAQFTQFPAAAIASGAVQLDLWYYPASSASTTITTTFSGVAGTFPKGCWGWEVSGFTNVQTDTTNGGTGVGVSNTDTGTTVTTTSATGFLVGLIQTAGSITVNPKAGNEFSSGGDVSTAGNAGASLISSTAASHQPVWTDSGATSAFVTLTGAFKERAASSVIFIQGD